MSNKMKFDIWSSCDDTSFWEVRCQICGQRLDVGSSCGSSKCCASSCSVFHLECMAAYLKLKLKSKKAYIQCPNHKCKCPLNLAEDFAHILESWEVEEWNRLQAEALVPFEERFYCPYPDCSALMWKDCKPKWSFLCSCKKITCYECKRELCVQCKSPWKSKEGGGCGFRRRGIFGGRRCHKKADHDRQQEKELLRLSRRELWRQCKKCKSILDNTDDDCRMVTCRCGFRFCLNCGHPSQRCRCKTFLTSLCI